MQEYTRKYEEAFLEDMGSLNLERPEKMVRATEHIREMAEFIAALEKKGIAYRTEDGSYYFRIAKFPEYGKLSKKDFAAWRMARAWTWTNMRKIAPATSLYGKPPKKASISGKAPSDGTSWVAY